MRALASLLIFLLSACAAGGSTLDSGAVNTGDHRVDGLLRGGPAPMRPSEALATGDRPTAPAEPPPAEPRPLPGRSRALAEVRPRAGEPDFPLSVGDDDVAARRRLGPNAREERLATGAVLLSTPFNDGCSMAAGPHRSDAHSPPCAVSRVLVVTVEGGTISYLEWRDP